MFLDAFVVRLTLVPAVMALPGKRIWYHPAWFAKHVPDPANSVRHTVQPYRRAASQVSS